MAYVTYPMKVIIIVLSTNVFSYYTYTPFGFIYIFRHKDVKITKTSWFQRFHIFHHNYRNKCKYLEIIKKSDGVKKSP